MTTLAAFATGIVVGALVGFFVGLDVARWNR